MRRVFEQKLNSFLSRKTSADYFGLVIVSNIQLSNVYELQIKGNRTTNPRTENQTHIGVKVVHQSFYVPLLSHYLWYPSQEQKANKPKSKQRELITTHDIEILKKYSQ